MIRRKFVVVVMGIALLFFLGYVGGRISTQFHPWGNWALGTLAVLVIAMLGAAWWDAMSKGVTNWEDYRKRIDGE